MKIKKTNRPYNRCLVALTLVNLILYARPSYAIYLNDATILENHMIVQRDKETKEKIDSLVAILYFQKKQAVKTSQTCISRYVSNYGEVPRDIPLAVRELRLKELDEIYKKSRPGYVVNLRAHVDNHLTGKNNPWKTTPAYGELLLLPVTKYKDELNRVTFETIGVSEITDGTADIELSAKVVGNPASYKQPSCLYDADEDPYSTIHAEITVISMEIFPSQESASTSVSQTEKPRIPMAPRWNAELEITPAPIPNGGRPLHDQLNIK